MRFSINLLRKIFSNGLLTNKDIFLYKNLFKKKPIINFKFLIFSKHGILLHTNMYVVNSYIYIYYMH